MGPFARIPQDPATDSELLVGALVARISVFWRDVLSGFQGSRTVFCVGVLGDPRLPPGGGAAAKRRLHRLRLGKSPALNGDPTRVICSESAHRPVPEVS